MSWQPYKPGRFGGLAGDMFELGLETNSLAQALLSAEDAKRVRIATESDEVKSEGRVVRSKPDPKGET